MLIDTINELIARQPAESISYKIEIGDEVFAHNEHRQYRSASTIKVPISIISLQHHINDMHHAKLNVESKVEGSGVLHTLRDINELSLWDTIVLSLIVSDNTAANMVMNDVGFEVLHKGFKNLGLTHSVAGLNYYDFEAAQKGKKNISTASDMFKVIQYLDEESDILPGHLQKALLDVLKSQQFNERVGGYIDIDEDKDEFIASKTGTVDGLEHEFGMIYKNGKKIKFSIFTCGWEKNQYGLQFLNDLGKIFNEYLI